ncbi:sensor histidine kinase [Dyella acidisoli]|uniref:Histidine kinase/HSP90-like ATPase domain-containing protein n=1 Tax=Dyella acidisoli TaxID=1867834 RepID=A0ABQ5XVB2_9GAMM|nr:histidine kinase [Dyella acidisoli]GLQ94898.1 hypothetical protein GCM10007901_38510 [Dyella acidisoli]
MQPDYSLDLPLPSAVMTNSSRWWSRYRRYPVFSLRWLLGRSLRFGICIGTLSALTGLSFTMMARDIRPGLIVATTLLISFATVCCAGPALATIMRSRRWPASSERRAIMLALLAGIALSFAVDEYGSAQIANVLRHLGSSLSVVPRMDPSAAIVTRLVNIVIRACLYSLLGGGLAWLSYLDERHRWAAWTREKELQPLREQRQQAEWRLGLLQAQVEPHFLFNTLASIRSLVRVDPTLAEHAIDTLGDYLRGIIPRLRDTGDGVASTLGQQLDLCGGYLELMRLRTGLRLDYEIEADRGLRKRSFPPLLLLTLVENAVKHGVEPRPGPGHINLRADRDEERRIRVRVCDDGIGLRPSSGSGTGLRNLREQLVARYGDRAHFTLSSPTGGGTEAILSVPDEDPT